MPKQHLRLLLLPRLPLPIITPPLPELEKELRAGVVVSDNIISILTLSEVTPRPSTVRDE